MVAKKRSGDADADAGVGVIDKVARARKNGADIASENLMLRDRIALLQEIAHTIWGNLELDVVLKHIMDVVSKVTGANAVLLYLLDSSRGELVLRASSRPHPSLVGVVHLKLGEGVTGWAAQHKEPVAIHSNASEDPRFKYFKELPEDRCEAFLAVPIMRRGKLIGVVNAHHSRPHRHDRETINLVAAIAQQAGGAIDNALLYEETRKRAEQLEMLSKVSGAMVSNKYLDEILQLIVSMTASQMRSKVCSLQLLDEDRGVLVIGATQSLSEEYRNKPPLKVGESVSGLVVQERKPLMVQDVQQDARYAHPEVARREGLRSLLCVPMMVRDRILGVLNLYTTEVRDFSKDEIQLLQTIANHAAAVIQNTHLLSETLHMREALESRKLVERAKGILQHELRLTEDKAFRLIQKKSMDSCKPMKDIAEAIILSSELHQMKERKKVKS